MGVGYPTYNLDPKYVNDVFTLIKQQIAKHFAGKAGIMWRPFRPDEINVALVPATRIYLTTIAKGPAATQIIGGAAAGFRIPPNSVYLFLGWIVSEADDWTETIIATVDPMCQILLNGTIKQEVSCHLVKRQPTRMLLLPDQFVVAEADSLVNVQVWQTAAVEAAATANLIYPLGFRIGTENQLYNN